MEKQGSGWLLFSSIILIVAGVMRVIDGIWALAYEGAIQGGIEDGLLGEKLENYGWLWLIVGAVLIAAGLAVTTRSQWARWVGIIAASIAAISAIVWIPYYPVWSLTYILAAFLVIYGLTTYGSREDSEGYGSPEGRRSDGVA